MNRKILALLITTLFFLLPVNAKEKFKYYNEQAGIHVFKINTKKYGKKIKPHVTRFLSTPQKVFEDNCYDLVVNGGYYDLKSGKSVSNVVIDKKNVADINANEKLVNDLKRQNRLEQVSSRAELRILENKRHKLKFDIDYHNAPIKKGYKIRHCLQAGPMVYPTMDLVKEGFVVVNDGVVKSQSADVLKRRERTAIGLKGKYLYIVLFTKEHKVDVKEMNEYMNKELKLKKIMAFDGGLSTAISTRNVKIGSIGKRQRNVKSFLIIER